MIGRWRSGSEGKVFKFDGAFAPRVLRFDGPFGPEVVVGALSGASTMLPMAAKTFTTGLRPRKTGRPRFARGNAFPLWWLAPPPCPVGSMSLDSRVAYSSPMNPVPLPPPQAGALWMLSHGAMSLQESIGRFILSPGWGKVRRSRIRGSRVAANHQNAYHAI